MFRSHGSASGSAGAINGEGESRAGLEEEGDDDEDEALLQQPLLHEVWGRYATFTT